jgi:hypothetical protein
VRRYRRKLRVPKIALLRRIRLRRMAAGGTTDWIGLLNANAGICARLGSRRNRRLKGRQQVPVGRCIQGPLHPSQHDQLIELWNQ